MMETFGLRRAHSLKSLSGDQDRSWVMPAHSRWDRRSVSQLVQQYQSCADLRNTEDVEHAFQGSQSGNGRWVRSANWESGRSTSLSRSRSMDFLPEREPSGTRALCALFESKATLQQNFHSSPRLNLIVTSGNITERDCPLQDWRNHNTPLKQSTIKRTSQMDRGKATNELPESYDKTSRYLHDNKISPSLTKSVAPSRQAKDSSSTSSSVRDRSVVYLSRAEAINSTRASIQPELLCTSGSRSKNNKMADAAKTVKVSQLAHEEDDLPPPPPPPVPPRPFDYEEHPASINLPVPPPKETFSNFYQQRQRNELKRLFKHIHPDLRESLDGVVDDEIMKAVEIENTQSDAACQCEVQSMRWIFENWTLDNIGQPHETKKLLDEEQLKGGDVRGTSSIFEHVDNTQYASAKRQTSVRGDVRTSTWLFETQPLDSLNQSKTNKGELVEAVLKEPIQPGDVTGTRLLFESRPLSDLGRCNSIEDQSFLKLRSELQEQKGDVQKTVKLFQADPCCAIRDNSGNIHKIKSICREEINSSNVHTAQWLFETHPLDLINKGTDEVKIIRGISLEEGNKGGVDQKRWMFETQSFDTTQELVGGGSFEAMVADCKAEADVINKRKLFETQPLADLKGDSTETSLEKEEIIGGDVKTSLWLFETQPMETLSDNCKVGHLKNITQSTEQLEKCEGGSIQKNTSFQEQEIEKGDVKKFKHLFETISLSKIAQSEVFDKEKAIAPGNLKDNKTMFETTPLYAIKDSHGNLHEVTTVIREEIIKGKFQNYRWMFETKPLDQLREDVEVIKGITRQEDTVGEVKMFNWLFETQTIDNIHSKFNQTEQSTSVAEEPCKCDVQACRWLFETQPMDILYEKSEKVEDKEPIDNTNVKSITWLFESQPLDCITDGKEYCLNLCNTIHNAVKSEVGIQTAKHLFETETLGKQRKYAITEQEKKFVSQVNFQSGDVSQVKELFKTQSLNEIGLEMESIEHNQDKHIEKGSVHKFTWMFENCPINVISKGSKDSNTQSISATESGDVQNKKFIFETSSLEKIQPLEQKSVSEEQPTSNVDVKSSTMMFESLPLYAIKDKEGQFHEVTTVKKEEVMTGDVRAARWMFETKPLDAIKGENEIYVIRAVTQEDIKKGDVKSARWRFETQPLDLHTSQDEPSVKVTEDFTVSNVQLNKQIFESEQACKKFVRMVSVTDVQQGDVRTSTWFFENQAIDSLKKDPKEQSMLTTVHREDNQKGDVKRCTWLFESQPLDKINEPEENSKQIVEDEIPKADVKCTTWLFETTPLDKICAYNVVDTLLYLHQMSLIHSSGIIIEGNEGKNVHMAKYLFESNEALQMQKEEVVEGNIRNIMLQLLLKPTLKSQVTFLREVQKGNINRTVIELPVYPSTTTMNFERDQRLQNIGHMIEELLVQDKHMKKGVIMQETADGRAEMSVYSLCNSESKTENHIIERGDVKSTMGNLLASASSQKTASLHRVDENERGNVNLYKSCIEKGDLHYLKSLYTNEDESARDQIEIVQGDVKEAKRSLCQQKDQVDRTISDVLSGDVKNTKKVFSSECSLTIDSCIPKEEIIPGDVSSAKQQLAVKQPIIVEKEEIVAGDIKATMQSLERAKQQSMYVERDIIKPGTIYDMNLSIQCPEKEGSQTQKEVIVSGDVKAAKKSLELAKQQSLHMEREIIVPGKIYNLNASTQEESPSATTQSVSLSSSRCQQTRNYPKVSGEKKDQERHVSFETWEPSTVIASNFTPESPPTFVGYEFIDQATYGNTAKVVRGDVKTAIRSLQSAATEQKLLDKEDVIRGNVQLALQSLEKSSVNVCKGDYKAAMIYRNSGRACSGRSETFHKQCVVVSMPPSDTKLSPSISVTCEGQPSLTTQRPTPNPVANSSSFSLETSCPLPQKNGKPKEQKPALPPKPQWAKSVVAEDPSKTPPSAPKDSCYIINNAKSTTNTSKHCKQFPLNSRDKVQQTTTHGNNGTEVLHENSVTQEVGQVEPTEKKLDCQVDKMDKNVIKKNIEVEEMQMCMKNPSENTKRDEINISGQNVESKKSETMEKRAQLLSKKVKVSDNTVREYKEIIKPTAQQQIKQNKSNPEHHKHCKTNVQLPDTNSHIDKCSVKHNEKQQTFENKVVLREKKVKETEDERRQRLSIHKEEIMKGNVKAAMEIFENLRKREELKGILSQVQEMEGESSSVDVSSINTSYENVPCWITRSSEVKKSKTESKKVDLETNDDDLESISSVETAFEDLEKASKEIMNLKEQTLAKLLDIEEAIKKALYSVSNLKSDADIAGLSGLFDESLKSEQSLQPANNIRKISIVSSKAKSSQIKETTDLSFQTASGSSTSKLEAPGQAQNKPLIRQTSSQSSPSFISIHSAARKPFEDTTLPKSMLKPETDYSSQSTDRGQESAAVFSRNLHSPAWRNVSVLKVKTVPEKPVGIIGTKTVSETYEETDGFGNVFVSSVKSTFVTKQSDSKPSSCFEVVRSPTQYEVVTSPKMQRSGQPFQDDLLSSAKEEGTVFVTFSQPKEKH